MIFKGVATALITPFNKDGVDYARLEKLLEDQLNNGIDALVILGTTGEPATMTLEEKKGVIAYTVKKVKGKLPIIVGTGANSTQAAIEMSLLAQEMGADALLVVTPYYNKCTQDGLIAHYTAIADAVKLPIICYNVPGRTGVNLLPATFAKIAEHKNIVAIKEASGNMEQIEECIRLSQGNAVVYSGDDGITIPIMAMGGEGIISVASNVIPKYVSTMCDNFFNGDLKTAVDMQLKMLPFVKSLFCEVNPIPVKRAAEELGFADGTIRLPLTRMTDKNAEVLLAQLKELR